MKAKVFSIGLLVALGLSITLASSCKKENVEPMTNQTVQASHLDLSNWGYDPSDLNSILKAAGYKKDVNVKTGEVVKNGPAVYDPDDPDNFHCQGNPNHYCGVIIHPHKGDNDLILTTQNTPTVINGISYIVVDENGNGHIIK